MVKASGASRQNGGFCRNFRRETEGACGTQGKELPEWTERGSDQGRATPDTSTGRGAAAWRCPPRSNSIRRSNAVERMIG